MQQQQLIFLCTLIICAWAADPTRPRLSSTCSFKYDTVVEGDQRQPTRHGMFGVIYSDNVTERMQVFNQTEEFNGTKTRHDFALDRMDTGIEYYANWTKGKSQSCVQYKGEAYVQNLWEGLEKYVFNGTRKLNGTELYIWALDLGEGERLELGVSTSQSDLNIPVMLAEVTRQNRRYIKVTYMIREYKTNPDKSMFAIPKICKQNRLDTTSLGNRAHFNLFS